MEIPGAGVVDLPGRRWRPSSIGAPTSGFSAPMKWCRLAPGEPVRSRGEAREVFFVAPEPHSGGSQDDMLTEIQIPIRSAA